ncbi:hypothetical protein [Wukongibacter sp. M2B1]|uniref:hypothetical protein n=1 Tax=Wukongibacter sp. M2B1 TaxID=3088895 RepID=UPI003D7AEB38
MKVFMDSDEHQAMKEKRSKKIKGKMKQNYGEDDDLEFLMKQSKSKKNRNNKVKNRAFKNNFKNYDYDNLEYYDIDDLK